MYLTGYTNSRVPDRVHVNLRDSDFTQIYATWLYLRIYGQADVNTRNLSDADITRKVRSLTTNSCKVRLPDFSVNLRRPEITRMLCDLNLHVIYAYLSGTRKFTRTWQVHVIYVYPTGYTNSCNVDLTLHEFMRPDITRIYMTWHYTNSRDLYITRNLCDLTLHEFTWP